MFKQFCKKGKQIISNFDLFSNSQFLRYKKSASYTSFSNGIISLMIITAVIVILIQQTIKVLSKTEITSSTTVTNTNVPSLMQIPFQFALVLNWNKYVKVDRPITSYLRFKAIVNRYNRITNFLQAQQISLQPCNLQIMRKSNPQFADTMEKLNLMYSFCPPSDFILELQGSPQINQMAKVLNIFIYVCSDPSECVDYWQIYTLLNGVGMEVKLLYTNPIINPNVQKYLTKAISFNNNFYLTVSNRYMIELFVSDYTIKSDQSLWPWVDTKIQTGGIITQEARIIPHTFQYILKISFYKSSSSILIQRSYTKLLDVLAYVGGLFTTVIALFFLSGTYNTQAYEIDSASQIYRQEDNKKIQKNYFNFFTFLGGYFYWFINLFKKLDPVPMFETFDVAKKQYQNQLDIRLIIQRLIFLQSCMEYLFQDFQIKCLHLRKYQTLKKAAEYRRRYNSKRIIIHIDKKKKQQSQQRETHQNPNQQQKDDIKEIILRTNKSIKTQNCDNLMTSDRELKKIQNFINDQWSSPVKKNLRNKSIIETKNDNNMQLKNALNFIQNSPEKWSRSQQNKEAQENKEQLIKLDSSFQSEELSQKGEKQFYQDIVNSFRKLQAGARKGEKRCLRIYEDLNEQIQIICKQSKIYGIGSYELDLKQTQCINNQ